MTVLDSCKPHYSVAARSLRQKASQPPVKITDNPYAFPFTRLIFLMRGHMMMIGMTHRAVPKPQSKALHRVFTFIRV